MTLRSIPLSTLVAGVIFCTLLCINSDHVLQTNAAAVPNAGLATEEGKSYTYTACISFTFTIPYYTCIYVQAYRHATCSPEIITIGPLESLTLGFASAACSGRGSGSASIKRFGRKPALEYQYLYPLGT